MFLKLNILSAHIAPYGHSGNMFSWSSVDVGSSRETDEEQERSVSLMLDHLGGDDPIIYGKVIVGDR